MTFRERVSWLRWTLRYWVLDKYRESLRGYAFFASVVLTLSLIGRLYLQGLAPPPPNAPVHAFINWIIQIVLIVVSALLSYALTPKPEQPKPEVAKKPEVEDGKSIRKLYGTRWIDDPMELGWKQMGTSKIKAKGSKK